MSVAVNDAMVNLAIKLGERFNGGEIFPPTPEQRKPKRGKINSWDPTRRVTGLTNRVRMGRKPTHWTAIDRDYETLRVNMQTLFHDLNITTAAA
jgi:hypothetical protein